jgi:hypothetical protein
MTIKKNRQMSNERVIYKYNPEYTGYGFLPLGASIIHIGLQGGELRVWAIVDPMEKEKSAAFYLAFTGGAPPDDRAEEYYGTYILHNGTVVHVFVNHKNLHPNAKKDSRPEDKGGYNLQMIITEQATEITTLTRVTATLLERIKELEEMRDGYKSAYERVYLEAEALKGNVSPGDDKSTANSVIS